MRIAPYARLTNMPGFLRSGHISQNNVQTSICMIHTKVRPTTKQLQNLEKLLAAQEGAHRANHKLHQRVTNNTYITCLILYKTQILCPEIQFFKITTINTIS